MKQATIIPMLKFENSNFPFKINTIRWIKEFGDLAELPHSHDHYEIIWIVKGSGIFCVDMQTCVIQDNQLFCIKPGQVHRLQADEQTEGFIFSFMEPFLNIGEHEFDWTCQASLFQLFSQAKGIILQNDLVDDMKELAERMLKEFNNQYSFRSEVLRRYLKIFMIYLTRQFEETFSSAKQTRNMELVQNFMSLVEKNFNHKKMVADYARLLSVTPNYLNEIVKKNTGYSAGHHIRQRVVLEAKRMGVYSDICMKEIAYSLGFADSAHFSKFFKVVTGTNFSEFKKERMTISIAV